jgi:two-component system NtrC family sensor kinase
MAGEKVLVIDDSAETHRVMEELVLGPNGYSFLGARDGQEGLRKAVAENPDLIVMDLQMPKMTGLEVLDALQKRQCDIPVILMTIHGSEEIAVQAFRLGVKDYIIKPFTVEEMLESIDRALTEVRFRKERDQALASLVQANRQLGRRVKELNILYGMGKSVASLLNLGKLLERVVEAAVYITGAEEGFLMLLDEEAGELYVRATQGLKEKYPRSLKLRVEDSIADGVVKTGEAVMIGGSDRENDFRTSYLFKALLSAPLKTRDKVIGVLSVDNKTSDKSFTDSDLYLLSALADYAAVAIENARLYEEAEERAQELRTAYEELEKTQEQMLAAERWAVLGKAAANLAHRINNTAGLIPVVAQDLEELLADVALEEERRQEIDADLQRIERNTRFTLQMADALFKPFEDLPAEECDVNALLEESLSVANVPEDVALKTKYADELPRVSASRRLADVFVELITNAVKAMPDNGQLEIGSRLGREGGVEVWFSDTGHGIPHESQDKIFDLFFTTSEGSLGFGLWWVKTFLEQQGAIIDVESEVGKGTTFTVRLPVEGPQAAIG